ncbi:MAG: hypothetical protein KH033_04995 [Clostridiales bacterium]|nr:hypothetical protein [Clostridiales bacterium]
MKTRPPYRRNYKKRTTSARNIPKEQSNRLANQMSAAVILCVFIMVIAYTNSSGTKKVKESLATAISRSVLDNFEDKGNIKDNIYGFVECIFSTKNPEYTENETINENKTKESPSESPESSVESPPV